MVSRRRKFHSAPRVCWCRRHLGFQSTGRAVPRRLQDQLARSATRRAPGLQPNQNEAFSSARRDFGRACMPFHRAGQLVRSIIHYQDNAYAFQNRLRHHRGNTGILFCLPGCYSIVSLLTYKDEYIWRVQLVALFSTIKRL